MVLSRTPRGFHENLYRRALSLNSGAGKPETIQDCVFSIVIKKVSLKIIPHSLPTRPSSSALPPQYETNESILPPWFWILWMHSNARRWSMPGSSPTSLRNVTPASFALKNNSNKNQIRIKSSGTIPRFFPAWKTSPWYRPPVENLYFLNISDNRISHTRNLYYP